MCRPRDRDFGQALYVPPVGRGILSLRVSAPRPRVLAQRTRLWYASAIAVAQLAVVQSYVLPIVIEDGVFCKSGFGRDGMDCEGLMASAHSSLTWLLPGKLWRNSTLCPAERIQGVDCQANPLISFEKIICPGFLNRPHCLIFSQYTCWYDL